MRVSEVVNTPGLHPGERRFESGTRYQEVGMVITPTVVYTGTWMMWLDAGGNDVGTYAISVLQGFQVLSFLAVIVLGWVMGTKVMP